MSNKSRYEKLTPEQKQKYYGESRNKRRRNRYTTDEAYRAEILQANREAYRERTGTSMGKDNPPDGNLLKSKIQTLHVRRYEQGPNLGQMRVVNKMELAPILRISRTTLMRWIRLGMLPPPELFEVRDLGKGDIDSRNMYYSEDEAKALFDVYSEHVKEFRQYSATHTQTTKGFFTAIDTLRKDWRK